VGRTWRVACASHDAGASATSASATSAAAGRKARRSMSSRAWVVRSRGELFQVEARGKVRV